MSDSGRAPDHLKPYLWKKGQSGNPNGRPKGTVNLTDRIRRELLKKIKRDETMADALAKRIVSAMVKDPVKAKDLIKSLQDRDEGPVERGDNILALGVGALVPELPTDKTGAGKTSLREHVDRLVSIATERGLMSLKEDLEDPGEITEAEIIPPTVDDL